MHSKLLTAKLQLAAAGLLMAVGCMASLPAAPVQAKTLAVVFPPWWTQAQIWTATQSIGDVVDTGGTSFVLIVHSPAVDLKRQAHRVGALLVLDPLGLGGCGRRLRPSNG